MSCGAVRCRLMLSCNGFRGPTLPGGATRCRSVPELPSTHRSHIHCSEPTSRRRRSVTGPTPTPRPVGPPSTAWRPTKRIQQTAPDGRPLAARLQATVQPLAPPPLGTRVADRAPDSTQPRGDSPRDGRARGPATSRSRTLPALRPIRTAGRWTPPSRTEHPVQTGQPSTEPVGRQLRYQRHDWSDPRHFPTVHSRPRITYCQKWLARASPPNPSPTRTTDPAAAVDRRTGRRHERLSNDDVGARHPRLR
jgi:hypothetical protein